MRVLVTGATGFIGSALVGTLIAGQQVVVRSALRRDDEGSVAHERVVIGEIDDQTEWEMALVDVDVVVHLAARVHQLRDGATDSLLEYRRTNVMGSLQLAEKAAMHGVRRLVYLSSVKVNGEIGVFRESDVPSPKDAYGVSKHQAELGLRAIASRTGLEVVVIRSPLVYGANVKGNFQRLVQAISRGTPLPFGAVRNSRSLVALDNLIDLIVTCLDHPAAANELFLVSDGEDLSTPALITRLGEAMGRRPRLVRVPVMLLRLAAALSGRRAEAQRLLGSLIVDSSKARDLLGWTPPVTLDEGLVRAGRGT